MPVSACRSLAAGLVAAGLAMAGAASAGDAIGPAHIGEPGMMVDGVWQHWRAMADDWHACTQQCVPILEQAGQSETQALEKHVEATTPGHSNAEQSTLTAQSNALFAKRGQQVQAFNNCLIAHRPTASATGGPACLAQVCTNPQRDANGTFVLGDTTNVVAVAITDGPAPKHKAQDEISWDAYFNRLRSAVGKAWLDQTQGSGKDSSALPSIGSFEIVKSNGTYALRNISAYGARADDVRAALCRLNLAALGFPARSKVQGVSLSGGLFKVAERGGITTKPRRYFELNGKIYVQ